MLLAKRCYAKDHIKSRNTLKLGTLFEYQATEIKEIADADEGTYVFSLNFRGTVAVERSWFQTLMQNTICLWGDEDGVEPVQFPGRTDAYFIHVNPRVIDGKTVELTDSTAVIKREALNSFIFCMAQVRTPEEAAEILPHYDSQWLMDRQRANLFAYGLGRLLLREIWRKRKKGEHVVPESLDLNKLDLSVQHGLVTYAPRALTFGDGCDLTLDRLKPLLWGMAFLKTPDYSPEKEYRFQYTLVYEGKIIEPLSKNLIITDVEALAALII